MSEGVAMRVLLIGGTGEVGHHVANGLVQRGHDVVVLTRGLDRRGFHYVVLKNCIGFCTPLSSFSSFNSQAL